MASKLPLELSPTIHVVGARPRKGRITHLQCWVYTHETARAMFYRPAGWLSIERVRAMMALGQKFQAARDGADGWLEEGAFLELIVQSENNEAEWDNLSEMQKRYRGE
ncbi:hypothetical protein [Nannocystis sp. SCPEA4]|uniref:hypothetical protein n=1 Tax=Nannocystis sp. SCPEA4 TaxID=2996787 RepID=UPI00226F6A2A|nr:hypothetical protein [Nannocystis sp. SCPEA4]MCY1055416.1 hypothetical protein [Nannocystis sp. SCPEA4]